MNIRIGSVDYNLSYGEISDEIKKDLEAVELAGYVDEKNSVIRISNGFNSNISTQAFWHEVVHAMLFELGMDDLSSDEGFVDALAKQIFIFHRDNNIGKIYEYIGDKKWLKS